MATTTSGPGPYYTTRSDVVRPEPASAENVSKPARSRRSRLPRSQSTGNMLDAIEASSRNLKSEPRNVIEEPSVRTNLRDFAKFFRTTAPSPPPPHTNHAHHAHSNSLHLARPGLEDNGRRSIQSLMKLRRIKKLGTQSLQLLSSDKAVTKRMVEGYPHATAELSNQPVSDRPWLPSQYPVLPGTTSRQVAGPPQWPERTTSRGVLGPASPTYYTPPTERSKLKPEPSMPELRTANNLGKPNYDDLKNFTEARLHAANFLRGLAEELQSSQDPDADNRQESMPRNEMKATGSQIPSSPLLSASSRSGNVNSHGATMEFPATPPPSSQLQHFEWPGVVINSAEPTQVIMAKPSIERRQQSSSSQIHTSTTSPKTQNAHKKLIDVATHHSLAVPEETLLPDSPGFPNMLAAMSFPTPPRTSRSPSLASASSFVATSPPTVRPRTSSRNVALGPEAAVSLNQIVMQPSRPGLSHSKSDCMLGISADLRTANNLGVTEPVPAATTENTIAQPSPAPARQAGSGSSLDQMSPMRPDSDTPFANVREGYTVSRAPSALSDADLHRQSTYSVSTSAESHRQSTSTIRTNHQSTRSSATTVSTGLSPKESPECDANTLANRCTATDLWLPETADSSRLFGLPHGDVPQLDVRDLSTAAITTSSGVTKPMSIAERRMVRRGQAGEYRERSIDLTRSGSSPALRTASSSDSVDSPLLGWFPQSRVSARKASIHGPSPLAQIAHSAPVIESVEDDNYAWDNSSAAVSESAKRGSARETLDVKDKGSGVLSSVATSPTGKVANITWSVSPIMTAGIAPELPKINNFTISPLIVVASVEPEASPWETSSLRMSTILNADGCAVPSLPLKSSRRPTFTTRRISRQFALPVKISALPSSSPRNANEGSGPAPARSSLVGFSSSPQPKSLKRLSLPVYAMYPSTPLTSWDRTSAWRRPELPAPPQPECEQESEPEVEAFPRRRSVVVKERFHLAKMAREREIADLVAKTAPGLPSTQEDIDSTQEEAEVQSEQERLDKQVDISDDIDRRIQLLEKHSDAWRSVLDPLLSNMTRTLKEMKQDGEVSPLLMREFVIDMAAEARLSILCGSAAEAGFNSKEPVIFEDFDGNHQPTEMKAEPRSAPESTVRIKKTGRGRSPSRVARLRLTLDQPQPQLQETNVEKSPQPALADIADTHSPTVLVSGKTSAEIPRTPRQHEFEAEMVVRKRIEAQEVMMDELMNKWGMPRLSQELARPTNIAPIENGADSKTRSRSSSLSTVKAPVKDSEESDTLSATLGALENAPLHKHWLKNEENVNALRASRRGSRRWSSAGERMSWKPGDSSFMNVLMQELRTTSRLSFESRADMESIL